MRSALLALALLLLGACAPSGPLLLAYEGSPAGRVAAELAVEEWVATCGVEVRLDPEGIPLVESEELPDFAAGMTLHDEDEAFWIRFRPRRGIEKTRATIVHEIGHALGLEHSPDRGDVMFEKSNGAHVRPEDCVRLPR